MEKELLGYIERAMESLEQGKVSMATMILARAKARAKETSDRQASPARAG
jgi:hypothetical protein